MLPLTLLAPLALQGISAGAQLIRSAKQKSLANKMNPKRPVMERTSASKELENRSRAMANTSRLPGQGYAEAQIGAQSARSANKMINTGGSTGEIIAGLGNVDRNAREATNELTYAGQQNRLNSEQYLGNALSMKQGEEREMFDYNKNQPYQSAELEKQALIDASNRNFEGALSTLGNLSGDIGTADMYSRVMTGTGLIGPRQPRATSTVSDAGGSLLGVMSNSNGSPLTTTTGRNKFAPESSGNSPRVSKGTPSPFTGLNLNDGFVNKKGRSQGY
jgi:hypothetical protein